MKMRGVKKQHLPGKLCAACRRPFAWQKKWGAIGRTCSFAATLAVVRKLLSQQLIVNPRNDGSAVASARPKPLEQPVMSQTRVVAVVSFMM